MDFDFRRDTDTRLPFNPVSFSYLHDITRQKFWDRQWEFCPVILQRHYFRQILRQDEIVPFAMQEKIDKGGYGDVWKAQLYPGRHELNSAGTREVIAPLGFYVIRMLLKICLSNS